MRAIIWAIRVTFADGRHAFVRQGGVIGHGQIASFYSKEKAEADAAVLRECLGSAYVLTVIERSHGRQFEPSASTKDHP